MVEESTKDTELQTKPEVAAKSIGETVEKAPRPKARKKTRRMVAKGHVHVLANFNNTSEALKKGQLMPLKWPLKRLSLPPRITSASVRLMYLLVGSA